MLMQSQVSMHVEMVVLLSDSRESGSDKGCVEAF